MSDNINQKKRGIKDNYFDIPEEEAVKKFLEAQTSEKRNEIYNTFLRKPLDKMISSIIRRYKLYRKDMTFEEIHNDTHSFLMTKVDKFNPSKNKKAYSYFGTICKNYLMGQIIKDQKDTNRNVSYEDISSSLEDRHDMIYYIDAEPHETEKIISHFIVKLSEFLETNNINDNEKKLGLSLLEILSNYDNIFQESGNNKFNKNIILMSIREMSNLNTKEIRTAMKKFKKLYLSVLNDLL
jgi:hypothetical protein